MGLVPGTYVPRYLPRATRRKIVRGLSKSRRAYERGKYVRRPSMRGVRRTGSRWTGRVRKLYRLPTGRLTLKRLRGATGCRTSTLRKIIRKGKGAYYSSGSRPNQTPESWGVARLYSALAGGPAAKVDFRELEAGCPGRGKTMRLARAARKRKIRRRRRVRLG